MKLSELILTTAVAAFGVACQAADAPASGDQAPPDTAAASSAAASTAGDAGAPPPCDPDDAGLTLPDGFCALVVADQIGPARHLAVADNGDVFVAIEGDGGVVALRDTTGDGKADVRERFGEGEATGVELVEGWLYFAPNDRVVRFPMEPGALRPAGPAEVLVRDLPAGRSHASKGIALGPDDALYVNVGAPSNACQEPDRQPGLAGQDPCPQLETRGGVWRFDATRAGQTQADGERFATGLRNTFALAVHPESGSLYGVQHGRDQLHDNWPDLFTVQESAEKPSEVLVRIDQGDDFGWPYCYHDPEPDRLVLAPEYGGDGREVGRCAEKEGPLVAFPAHWGPHDLLFYTGESFPAEYRGGAFVVFHGSWNRAPMPQAGYRVVFQPMSGGQPSGEYRTFADGFAGPNPSPNSEHRPAGIAQGPDGSLYVSDDHGGRIWRIVHTG